jgi:hypothetical protein
MCYIRDLHAVKFNRVLYEVRQYAHAQAFAPVLLEFMRHTRDEDSPVWQATTDGADLESDEVLDFVAAKLQLIAPSLETEWQRLEAQEQAQSLRLEANNKAAFAALQAQALERVTEHKRATPFALVIDQLNLTHTKRARTEAIHV